MTMIGTDHYLTGLGQLVDFNRNSPSYHGEPDHEGYFTGNVVTPRTPSRIRLFHPYGKEMASRLET